MADGSRYTTCHLMCNERIGDRVRQVTLPSLGAVFGVPRERWRGVDVAGECSRFWLGIGSCSSRLRSFSRKPNALSGVCSFAASTRRRQARWRRCA